MSKVAFLRTNSVTNDPRVIKESKALAKAGFSVLVLAWDREKTSKAREFNNGIVIKRLKLSAPIGSPSLILYFPIFWLWALIQVLVFRPAIIHACDFDTMPIGFLLKVVNWKMKIAYDCFEYYPGMVDSYLNFQLKYVVSAFDKLFVKIANCVIIPCEERRRFYDGGCKTIVVPNVPKTVDVSVAQVKNVGFTLFYGGGLEVDRGILFLIKTVMSMEDVQLFLAGDGKLKNIVIKSSELTPNIKFLGMLPTEDLLKNTASAHATVAMYEPVNINNVYSASTKVFDSMMLGVPVITNEGCASSSIILKHNCGIVVPYGSVSALKCAISSLKENPEFRQKLGRNGRNAFKKWYAWEIVEPYFIEAYSDRLQLNQ